MTSEEALKEILKLEDSFKHLVNSILQPIMSIEHQISMIRQGISYEKSLNFVPRAKKETTECDV